MRYDPATYVRTPWTNAVGPATYRPISSLRPGDREGAMSRQAAELDIWEDEGGSIAGHELEFPCWSMGRHFDEFAD